MTASPRQGLSAAEVAEKIRLGQVNRTRQSHLAEYGAIVARNLFTLFNILVTPAAIALFALRNYPGAVAVSGMAVVNTTLALIQEIRAKWHLDRLAILVETHVQVWRDGSLHDLPAGEVVLGEHIQLRTGDSIVADGALLEANFLEVDEALLTGESDPVRRQAGDQLLSGSFCVAGEGIYRADRVGKEAFAQRTSAEARRYHHSASPLTRQINVVIHVLSYTAIALSLMYVLLDWLAPFDPGTLVGMIAATITSMVPQGLVLTATMSFTLGAIVMSQRGAVVQRLHAVETMAGIDVICTDKTGTLTTNQLQVDELMSLAKELPEVEIRRRLQLFVSATMDRQNKNIAALLAALGEARTTVLDQLPFKSQNRYSAVRIREDHGEHLLVLGAPEALWPRIPAGQGPSIGPAEERTAALQQQGLRVLLFCEAEQLPPGFSLADATTLPELPLAPLALIALRDELRPEAEKVLEALYAQGIAFKVVSGDNPSTVRATLQHLHLPLATEGVVTGDELNGPKRVELIAGRSVFGRVNPAQKVEIVETLQDQGRRVAMIGDGVNDVLPIKRADLGIAMGAGSQASKTVASLVLENNNFALLPETLEEGRTIIRNLRRSGKLFLVKNVYSLIFILVLTLTSTAGLDLFALRFPYEPQQVTLLNWLVIGIPAFVIALSRERSTTPTRSHYLTEVGWFALRTGVVFAVAGLTVLFVSRALWDSVDDRTQHTMLLTVLILLGITALLRSLTDGEPQPLKGDTRLRWLAVLALPAYLLAMYLPLSQWIFELVPLSLAQWLLVLAVVVPAYLLTLASDRLPNPLQGVFRSLRGWTGAATPASPSTRGAS
jgi:cation-transporting ATPase E